MNENNPRPYYFFNIIKGEVIPPGNEPPGRKASIYMVIRRENLLFKDLTIKTKKKLKINDILNIQKAYVPFSNDFLNLIYRSKKKKISRFFYWVGHRLTIEKEDLAYDEVPESFIFKGDPQQIKNYNLFLFKRSTGYEIIYFNGEIFYSTFEKKEQKILEKIYLTSRKFPGEGKIKIFSEIDLTGIDENYSFDLINDDDKDKYIFLPAYFQFDKVFSNISRDKYQENLKSMATLAERFSIFFLIATLLVFILLMLFNFYLKRDNEFYKEKFSDINKVLNAVNLIEYKLINLKEKISSYPDYLMIFKIVNDTIDKNSYLTRFSINKNKVILRGFSNNSLLLLNKLRKSRHIKKIEFKNPVTKDVYSKKERFVIEMEF